MIFVSINCFHHEKVEIVQNSEKTILIVEDDHKTSSLVALYLEREGFQTIIADDGLAAIEILNQQQPDFVILDQDIMEVPIEEVPNIKIDGTYINGEKVYSSTKLF